MEEKRPVWDEACVENNDEHELQHDLRCYRFGMPMRGRTMHRARAVRKAGFFGPIFVDTAAVPQPLLLFGLIC